MKKLFYILVFLCITIPAISQSNIRLNNFWGNTNYINPASIYDKYKAVFSIAAQKQWAGIEGSPTTFFASGTTYLEKYHTQLGASLVQSTLGYTSITNLNVAYAYALVLRDDWQVHMGLGGNYQSVAYDLSKVCLETDIDNIATQKLVASGRFNVDMGAELSNKTFKVGVASQNLLSLFPSDIQLQTNTNFIYAKYHNETNSIVNLGAGICGIQYANLYQMEFNITGYFKNFQNNGLTDKPDLFDLGMFYRTGGEAGLIFGINITDAIHLSYTYDYHFGGIRFGSFGTNELLITFNIRREPMCHNCWY